MTDERVILNCDVCGRQYQHGPHRYEGNRLPAYGDISCCDICWRANWDRVGAASCGSSRGTSSSSRHAHATKAAQWIAAAGRSILMEAVDLETLARHIAARLAPDALLDAADVGLMLKCSARQVTERFAKTKDFPKPIPLAIEAGARSRLRWLRSDIAAWIRLRKDGPKRGGRPRKPVE